MESYDVVIVGAGPAGLNCAQKLSEAGKKVLLLEQNKIIGPKICAGGLTGQDLEYLKLPDNILGHKFNKVTIHTPLQKCKIKLDAFSICTIDRKDLGQWQFAKLKKTGAAVRTKARVTKIEKDHVIVNGTEKIGFKYLVGADGSASLARRFLGVKTDIIGIAIQYIIPGNKYKDFEYFVDSSLFKAWYAWIFPHKDYVSVGTGGDPRYVSSKELRENFAKWLSQKGIDVSGLEIQGYPINFDYRGHKFGNIFLAGDAAGLASGLTGEGIYQALISGEEIAKSIIDENYVSDKIKKLLKEQKKHHRILNFFIKSGELRKVEFEIIIFWMKIHWFLKNYF
ncbi:MAG: NAD(P)/FAD-dependent oxidoreductase [Patescibacteria group bacterium]